MAVREDIKAEDVTVSVEAQNKGQFGILLRYQERNSYLAGLCMRPPTTQLCSTRWAAGKHLWAALE